MLHKLLCLITIALAAAPAEAGGLRSRCNVRVNHNVNAAFNHDFNFNQFVGVPYAIPVGVPVARQGYVNYSASFGQPNVGYNYSSNYETSYNAGFNNGVQHQASVQSSYGMNAGNGVQSNVQARYRAAANPCPPCPECPQPNHPTPAPSPQPQPAPVPAPAPALSMVQQSCVKCHSGATAKGNFALDAGVVTCEQKLAAIKAVMDGKMPKDQVISQDQRDALIRELTQ